MSNLSRRNFINKSLATGAVSLLGGRLMQSAAFASTKHAENIKLGLVTFRWAEDWDLPTIIRTLEASKVLGVELRTTHAHGVEPSLDARARREVKARFDNSPVELVSLGSDERFDNPAPAVLKKAIKTTKAFVKLSHDLGCSGVKVKPNSFHKGVSHQTTIEQIGKSLNIVGKFAGEYGQQIRLEVHGGCQLPKTIKQIMDIADNPNVAVCWNSNQPDLKGRGLEYNFNLLKGRLGKTCHIRTLDDKSYPFQELINLLVAANYEGWLLMECHTKCPHNPVEELARQQRLLPKMLAKARSAK